MAVPITDVQNVDDAYDRGNETWVLVLAKATTVLLEGKYDAAGALDRKLAQVNVLQLPRRELAWCFCIGRQRRRN